MIRNGQQSVSTCSSGVHKPRELRKRQKNQDSSRGGKKHHARGEGGVPVSRPRSALIRTKNKHTNKQSSSNNDMEKNTKRNEQEDKVHPSRLLTSPPPPVEDSDDDDISVSSSNPPPPMKRKKKTNKADLKQGKVPEGFSYKTLRNGYRDYIIKDNDSEEKKEKKKTGLVAFHYFVDRILASVNADQMSYARKRLEEDRNSL
eukprot:scaffold15143_cov70-Cylindrotheca_fusiformis.AAC.1